MTDTTRIATAITYALLMWLLTVVLFSIVSSAEAGRPLTKEDPQLAYIAKISSIVFLASLVAFLTLFFTQKI